MIIYSYVIIIVGGSMYNVLNNLFRIPTHKSSISTEIIAGITTFLTMVYIIILNPIILSDTGMDKGSVFVATVLISAIASIAMGLLANWPVALAPGMGLNAYFTYTVVLSQGLSWQTALFAVFCSGVLFFVISITPLRKKLLKQFH